MNNFNLSFILVVLSISACLSEVVQDDRSVDYCAGVNPGEIVYLPYPGDCTRWITCYNGEATVSQCDDDLWWHEQIENCDYPGEYCRWSTDGTPPTHATTGGLDPYCADGIDQYWPHPDSCHLYIECHQGHAYEMMCPGGLYFSYVNQDCGSAAHSECCIASPEC